MKNIVWLFLLTAFNAIGQQTEYKFKSVIDLTPSPVCNQGKTGTCWSFATVSFLESEVYRINGKFIDLSEMYPVRKTYPVKAYNFVYRQGKAQFGEGGLGHDVINAVTSFGVVPQKDFIGLGTSESGYNHSELITHLESYLKNIVDNPKENLKPDWMNEFDSTLDKYIGKAPEKFVFEGKEYTPEAFAKSLKINPEDYVTLTSFTHHPAYSKFILEIPDNFSNGSYYNLPLDEYIEVLNESLNKGFTVALDSDVSEKSFSSQAGMAIWPSQGEEKDYFKVILPEKWVTTQERQAAFENYSTQDDHLMQITGLVKDQIGNQYYDVKNSWGIDNRGNGGHIYMSIPFFRMKSIAYTVHKDALSNELKKRLGIL